MEQGTLQGWHADPFGLHEKRYFSGGQPTKLVRDGDAESYDEPPEVAAPEGDEMAAAAAGGTEESKASTTVATADAVPTGHLVPGHEPQLAAAASARAADPGSAVPETSPADSVESYLGVLLRRRPRGLVYTVMGLVAVVAVIAVVAITGAFSSRPVPGTFGALAGSSSGSTVGSAPLDRAGAALVTASAQRTLAGKTADVSLSGLVASAGRVLPLQGSGQVDFGANALTADMAGTYPGGSVAEKEVVTSRNVYLQLAFDGHNPLTPSTGRHWITIPMTQLGTGLTENITGASVTWSLQLLAQQPEGVVAVGTKHIRGLTCDGYRVTPSKQAVIAVVQQEWGQLGLTRSERGAAGQALEKTVPAPITAWFDPNRQLLCQLSVNMQFSAATPRSWSSAPGASAVQMAVSFTHYGVPVHIAPPSRSDSVLF